MVGTASDQIHDGDDLITSGTIMDATRLAAVCAKIDEYAARGAPMSGNKIAAICAMIDDGATARKHGRNRRRRRRRLCVDSTRSYKQIGEVGNGSFGAPTSSGSMPWHATRAPRSTPSSWNTPTGRACATP